MYPLGSLHANPVRNVIFKMDLVGLIVSLYYIPAALDHYVGRNVLSNSFNVTQLHSCMSESDLLSFVEIGDLYSIYDTVWSYMAPDTAQVTPAKVVEIGDLYSIYDTVWSYMAPDTAQVTPTKVVEIGDLYSVYDAVPYIVVLLILSAIFLALALMLQDYQWSVVFGCQFSNLGDCRLFTSFCTESHEAERHEADGTESHEAESNEAESTESHEHVPVHNKGEKINSLRQGKSSLSHETSIQRVGVSPSQASYSTPSTFNLTPSTFTEAVPVNANAVIYVRTICISYNLETPSTYNLEARDQILKFCSQIKHERNQIESK